ncbi:ASB3, partial [Symbiodinium sp. KB8]
MRPVWALKQYLSRMRGLSSFRLPAKAGIPGGGYVEKNYERPKIQIQQVSVMAPRCFLAAGRDQLEMTRILPEANADKDKSIQDGATPLVIAAENGQLKVARLLQEANADMSKAVRDGATAQTGQLQAMDDGFTPLRTAAQNGKFEVASWRPMRTKARPRLVAVPCCALQPTMGLLLECTTEKDEIFDDSANLP